MLRAAYFAQELLSTFNTALGEVALQPATGGTFVVEIFYTTAEPTPNDGNDGNDVQVQHHVLWDRKAEGGFPETKELKRRVRDIIEPGRDLGHVDRKKKTVVIDPVDELGAVGKVAEGSKDVQERQEPPQRPRAFSRLQGQDPESERKFTPMDVDSVEVGDERAERDDGINRNPDGSVCEDCN